MSEVVGGGGKKVLYTLNTVRRIGLRNSTKALKAKNACKACGLGMGGQLGGMTNEKQEFPSVCNKSIQAQSTDIQSPIPKEVFEHSIEELKQLSAKELEHMGRLNFPLYKAKDSEHFQILSWPHALQLAANRFKEKPASQSFFYSSGRSSNEAAFLLQLFARIYGSSNINNCSYYCHQATGVGLKTTLGTGTSTVELDDLAECDLFFLLGANPASNHPRLIHQLKGIRERGGDVVVINPAKEPGLVKFAVPKSPKSLLIGGHYIASYYLQPNIASDLWLLKALAKAVLELGAEDRAFIEAHTQDFEPYLKDIQALDWRDAEQHTGLDKADIMQVAQAYAKAKKVVFAWGMGITHQLHGSDNVEYIANLALLRGMVGQSGAGLLPLRGHSNIQGVGTLGVKPVLDEDVFDAMEQHLKIKLSRDAGMDTLACLEAAERGEIANLMAMGGNLYAATPNSIWADQVLDRIGFKLFLTTTLNQGHLYGNRTSESLILPVAARDEEREATTQESMFNFVRMSDGGITRLDGVKPETDILCDLAERVIAPETFDFSPFREHASIRHAIAACVPGMEALDSIDVAKQEFHIGRRLMHKPEFFTATGKAHFVVRGMPEALCTHEFPFKLSTIRSEGQFNSIIYEDSDSYRSVNHRNCVLMNAEDMRRLGLSKGSLVDLCSSEGSMQGLEAHAFDLPPGNALSYYPEANVLVNTQRDPRSKTPSFKCVAVAIEAHESTALKATSSA